MKKHSALILPATTAAARARAVRLLGVSIGIQKRLTAFGWRPRSERSDL